MGAVPEPGGVYKIEEDDFQGTPAHQQLPGPKIVLFMIKFFACIKKKLSMKLNNNFANQSIFDIIKYSCQVPGKQKHRR